jgi:hypothetical protein
VPETIQAGEIFRLFFVVLQDLLVFGQSSRWKGSLATVPNIKFKSYDLLVTTEIINQVGHSNASSIASQANHPLKKSLPDTGHKHKRMSPSTPRFAFLSIEVFFVPA